MQASRTAGIAGEPDLLALWSGFSGSVGRVRLVGAVMELHQYNGGHRVSDEDSIRLDPPIFTPDDVESWTGYAQFAIGVIAAFLAVVLIVFQL